MKNVVIYILMFATVCWFAGWLIMDEWRNKDYRTRYGSGYWMHTLTVLLYGVSAMSLCVAVYVYFWSR